MLTSLYGKEVAIYFIDGTSVNGGTLEQADDTFVKYRTEYEDLYIPVTSIRSITVNTKERQRPRIGFGIE
ncbi:hypothetical protein [Paenibacillus beijingensis]|uniref:Uncharacterized protein n=1 Tax=Paenibacillus beijingensis TaxID=1126833 RepID=A0A0D5NGR8_9BACL|nr:hypothetical protein [Paenibacillus beijingensis]AJY74132.1 hypothetical protein VN24_05365 [Paenibacillus beijingensis]